MTVDPSQISVHEPQIGEKFCFIGQFMLIPSPSRVYMRIWTDANVIRLWSDPFCSLCSDENKAQEHTGRGGLLDIWALAHEVLYRQ